MERSLNLSLAPSLSVRLFAVNLLIKVNCGSQAYEANFSHSLSAI